MVTVEGWGHFSDEGVAAGEVSEGLVTDVTTEREELRREEVEI